MRVIALANQKGGVGKTTSTINLGACLASLGKRVLICDMDPQGNATEGLGLKKNELNKTIYNVLVDHKSDPNLIVVNTAIKNCDILPSNIDLAAAEIELVQAHMREFRLKMALEKIRNTYDYILIDCPPSLGILTTNSLVAASEIFVPVDASFYALAGLDAFTDTVQIVKDLMNPHLAITGAIVTMYDSREKLAAEVFSAVKNFFGATAFDTVVRRNVKVREAPGFGQPINMYDPKSAGAEDYLSLAKEVIAREPKEGAS